MNVRRHLRDLEDEVSRLRRRVGELEARPVIPMVIIQPAEPTPPPLAPWPGIQPWQPFYGPSVHDQTVQPFGANGTFISSVVGLSS